MPDETTPVIADEAVPVNQSPEPKSIKEATDREILEHLADTVNQMAEFLLTLDYKISTIGSIVQNGGAVRPVEKASIIQGPWNGRTS